MYKTSKNISQLGCRIGRRGLDDPTVRYTLHSTSVEGEEGCDGVCDMWKGSKTCKQTEGVCESWFNTKSLWWT